MYSKCTYIVCYILQVHILILHVSCNCVAEYMSTCTQSCGLYVTVHVFYCTCGMYTCTCTCGIYVHMYMYIGIYIMYICTCILVCIYTCTLCAL